MAIVTGDRYLESLVKFVEKQAGPLIEGSLVLKLNPVGLHYVHSRLEALQELEGLLAGAPVDYLRAYVSDLGDHRALEQLRRILCLLPSLKVVSVLPYPARDPMPLPLWRFRLLRVLELRGCDISTLAAKGLLELRHTLEKIICHNSTDALRHAFASRIAEIKASPQWNRLSFVSCACNGLVLMDESLLLLPMAETLDLSGNKFAEIDNLWKCTKLKHLDLGFNHLRTVASFSEATYHIVKLVLRNNALATLHGLENLKSLEGLDLSYNVISNFSELEILTGLPCLHSLWLEGNPLCCACWYRAEVFAYFSHPHKVNLDERGITFIELWKRQIIIIASKLKRPASFGFYSLAEDDNEGEGSISPKRQKKPSRLACIESGEQGSFLSSDLEAPSCDNEIISNEDKAVSDEEVEIAELMNRVELMKKEHSVFWLREFKEWMYEPPEDLLDYCKYCSSRVYPGKENHVKDRVSRNDLGESSGDKNCSCILGSENSSAVAQSSLFNNRADPVRGKLDLNHHTVARHCMPASDDILDSHSSFGGSGSPPHYKEDMLHRRQSLVEEILELSVDSFSLTSSESYSSGSEDDFCESKTLIHEDLCSTIVEKGSDESIFDSHGNDSNPECLQTRSEILPAIVNEDKDANSSSQAIGEAKKQKSKRKPKHRVVSLSEESDILSNAKGFTKIYKGLENLRKNHGQENDQESDFSVKNNARNDEISASTSSGTYGIDDFIQDYFNKYIGDARVHEICKQCICCGCIAKLESKFDEREVAVLLSSEQKLYVLLIGTMLDESGAVPILIGCHKVGDVQVVSTGVGLQVVRVCLEGGVAYLFIMRDIEKSRQFLCGLESRHASNYEYTSSLEQVQVELFEKQICGGSKKSIFQYSLVLFFWNFNGEGTWLSRSLFVIGGHVVVCYEDFMQLVSPSRDTPSSPYFCLDSYCSIADVSEMVVETKERRCVTLALKSAWFASSCPNRNKKICNRKAGMGSATWRIRWFSEENLLKFVALIKACYAETSVSPLPVRCIPSSLEQPL